MGRAISASPTAVRLQQPALPLPWKLLASSRIPLPASLPTSIIAANTDPACLGSRSSCRGTPRELDPRDLASVLLLCPRCLSRPCAALAQPLRSPVQPSTTDSSSRVCPTPTGNAPLHGTNVTSWYSRPSMLLPADSSGKRW